MKVTIKDIARYAGVSTATVSKVINKKDSNISEDTRAKVLRVVKEYGYVPNRVASSMVTKKTKTLGLVIPNIANPFFPEVARGAEDKANQEGYNLILCNTDDKVEKEDSYISMLQEKMVDGIIFTASSGRLTISESLKKINVPVITVDRDIEDLKTKGKITVDNVSGAYAAVKYMLSRGYKRIIHICGPLTSTPTKMRILGFEKAMIEAGYNKEDLLVIDGEYLSHSGEEAIMKVINSGYKFDGVFCGNDLIALGAIKALKRNNYIIPNDIGIVGYDDIYMSRMIDPELSTVNQPTYDMGYKAAELLIKMLSDEDVEDNEVILGTKLIVRGTTR